MNDQLLSTVNHPSLSDRASEAGVEMLTDHELLAAVVGDGAFAPAQAAALLAQTLGLTSLARLGSPALAELPGMSALRASQIAAAFEVGRRAHERATAERARLRGPRDVVGYIGPMLRALDHEELWLVGLDNQCRILGARRVAMGGVHGCSIIPRDVLRIAVRESVSCFVLAHNHPGGNPAPSDEDQRTTTALHDAADRVGVPMLDHLIIVPDGTWCALSFTGLLRKRSTTSTSPSAFGGRD